MEQLRTWSVSGRDCAGTPDVRSPLGITDLKVVHDASPLWFARHASRQGWLGQLVWYHDGIAPDADVLRIVAVEQKPPHCVQVYQLDESAIEQGRRHWRSLFERLLTCESAGYWPAYSDTVLPLEGIEQAVVVIDGEEISV